MAGIHEVEPDVELELRAKREREEYPDGTVRPFAVELANRGQVTAKEWAVRMSSPERELIIPSLEHEVFVQHVEHCLSNCERRDGISYDDAVISQLAPEACKRLRWLLKAAESHQQWRAVVERQVVTLQARLQALRFEVTRITRLVSQVVKWAGAEQAGPFKHSGDYADGVLFAKRWVRNLVLGRIDAEMGQAPVKPLQAGNSFAVTAKDDTVVVAAPPFPLLPREEAVRLAAWLVVGAELAGDERALDRVIATVEAIHDA